MKINILRYAVLIVVIFGALAAASRVSAQMVGAYADKSIDDKGVIQAAAFAVRKEASKTGTRITLVKIEKAETQVVAGLNYRVCMTVKVGRRKPKTTKVTAVVYSNLHDKLKLSKWEDGECKDL